MKRFKLIIIIAILPFSGFAQMQEANTLQVTGVSEMQIAPDMFRFDMRFTVTTTKMKKSIDSLNKAMDKMIRCITGKTKVKSDSLKTSGFNTYTNDNRYDKKRATTHTANQTLQLTIKANSDDIIKMLNIIAEANTNANVNTNSFFSKAKKLEVEELMINSAFDNARAQANMLGKVGNFDIRHVRSVNYNQGAPFQVRGNYKMETMQMDQAENNGSFGGFTLPEQTLSKRIDISFFIRLKEN